jgi:hypothetical protein
VCRSREYKKLPASAHAGSTKSTYMRASSQPSEASEETPVPVQVPKVLSTDWKVRFWSLVNTGTAL